MDAAMHANGYSAPVTLELRAHGQTYPVAQVGDGSLILRDPRRLPPGPAEIIVTVAGVRDVHEVVLYPSSHDDDADEVFFW
jgi:hypothetical protein